MNRKLLKTLLECDTRTVFDITKDVYPHACIEHHNGLYLCHVDNGSNVLGVAHSDTVCKGRLPGARFAPGIVESIALDDRLGIYTLLFNMPFNCDILITDGEESGRSTAAHFAPSKQYHWMFELDRRGTDAVCYEYNEMEYIACDFFDVGLGSFSDICSLQHLECLGVNIGIGYYKEHTDKCFAVFAHYNRQLKALHAMHKTIHKRLPYYADYFDYWSTESKEYALPYDELTESDYFIK